jgi:hypothetical protein
MEDTHMQFSTRLTKAEAEKQLQEMGFTLSSFRLTYTDDDRCRLHIVGNSTDEDYLGSDWEEVIEDFKNDLN